MVEQSGSERADLLERQLRDTHLEVRQLRREIREAHQLIQTLFSTRDIHHHRLLSLEHRLGLCPVPRLPRNVQDPDSQVHQPISGPSLSSPVTGNVHIPLSVRIQSPVSPTLAACILLPASSSSDTLFSDNNASSSSVSEHILPVFTPAPVDLTEGNEENPIILE